MFEFNGKLPKNTKFISVTEARAKFADILSDAGSFYIITKNNHPLRAVVSFNQFQAWLSSFPDARGESPALPGQITNRDSVERIEVARTPDVAEEAGVQKTPENAEDYFHSGGEDAEEAGILLPPEEAVTVAEGGRETHKEPPAETQREATSMAEETSSPVETSASGDVASPLARTPEEEEYYRRYQKLYESFYARESPDFEKSAPVAEAEPEGDEEEIQPQGDEKDKGANDMDLGEGGAEESVQNLDGAGDDRCSVQNDVSPNDSAPIATTTEGDTTKSGEMTGKKTAGSQGLPSLQDLLRDLETQRLVTEDEEKGLGTEEIDELINRITSD